MAQLSIEDHARVDEAIFTGVLWGGLTISFGFFAFRICARLASFGTVFVDDVLVFSAWIILLSITILLQSGEGAMYLQYTISEGKAPPTPENLSKVSSYFHIQIAVDVLLVVCITTVKLSFLAFFWRLGQKVKGQKILWWSVTGITIAGCIVSIGILPYRCTLDEFSDISVNCFQISRIVYVGLLIRAICGMDVASDGLILLIPIVMLWKVKIELRKKLILMGLFSLSLIVIAVTMVRIVVSSVGVSGIYVEVDVSWIFLWSVLEVQTAIIVACITSFHQYFVKQDRADVPRKGLFAYLLPKSRGNSRKSDSHSKRQNTVWPRSGPRSPSSEEIFSPTNSNNIPMNSSIPTNSNRVSRNSSVPMKYSIPMNGNRISVNSNVPRNNSIPMNGNRISKDSNDGSYKKDDGIYIRHDFGIVSTSPNKVVSLPPNHEIFSGLQQPGAVITSGGRFSPKVRTSDLSTM